MFVMFDLTISEPFFIPLKTDHLLSFNIIIIIKIVFCRNYAFFKVRQVHLDKIRRI